MNTIIIDDNQRASDELKSKLIKYSDIQVLGTAANGAEGLVLMAGKKPELLFLDVELPDMSGIEFLDMLQTSGVTNCYVVIYTAFNK